MSIFSRSSPLRIALAASALLACTDEADEISTTNQEAANLDDLPTAESSSQELTMRAGRESRLPLSRVFDGVHQSGLAATIRFRARCIPTVVTLPEGQDVEVQPAADLCDPGLVVVADSCTKVSCTRNVLFDNNSPEAGGNGKGAFIQTSSSLQTTFRVIAYSHLLRGTSKVAVEWSTDGKSWSPEFTDPTTQAQLSGANQIVGGTLVKLGPVRSGDYVGVRTPDDGASANTGTRLYAFDTVNDRFIFNDGPTSGDRDPVTYFDATWSAVPFVIAAKDVSRPADGGPGLETFVDLIRGPLTSEALVPLAGGNCVGTTSTNSTTRVACAGTGVALSPGQYHAYVYAHTAGRGVGAVVPGGSFPSSATGDSKCGTTLRGRANDLGFTMKLLRDGKEIERRHVPRGAIGSDGFDDPNDPTDTPYDRFLIAFDVTDTGHTYSVNIEDNAVFVRGSWGYARNPETVEMKIASLNIEPHADYAQTTPMMQNVAELLGTRVRYQSTGEITDRANHGQWQWESDVIALQEIRNKSSADEVVARLEDRTDRDWDFKWALGTWKNRTWPVSNYVSFAPIFAAAHMFASATDHINFTPTQLETANCDDETSESSVDSGACKISSDPSGDGGYQEDHFVVPARTKVTRIGGAAAGSTSRPIPIINMYMSDDHQAVRTAGATEMIQRIRALMQANPAAFNADGVDDPRWQGNRMILLGDTNMNNHQCAEVNETLVKLRNTFGYAVEVPMAQLDAYNRTMDSHYSGAAITDPHQGIYGSCSDPSWARTPNADDATPTGCPFRFKHVESWHDDVSSPSPSNPAIETGAKYATDPSQWYTWWGATSAGGNGGSRLDTIILVGRGWAYDDPVLHYGTISDVNFVNFNNNYLGGGVEVMLTSDLIDADCYADETPNLVTVPGSYAPAEALYGATTASGQPVYCSDHKPIGVRLRLSFVR